MIELAIHDYARVRPLLAEAAAVHVSIGSVLDGYSPGFVTVDDAAAPTLAFLSTPEGEYLVGDETQLVGDDALPGLRENLATFMQDKLFGELGWQGMHLKLPPDWSAQTTLFAGGEQLARRYYTCTELAFDWRASLPKGYEIRRLDCDLLTDPAIAHSNGREGWRHVCNWMINGWFSMARFLRDGFGFVMLHDGQVVSYSLADGRSGDECEIGIHTVEAHRQQGLAAITAAAAVDYALANGYRLVGWHCDDENVGSWRTAERVGFAHATDYTMVKVSR